MPAIFIMIWEFFKIGLFAVGGGLATLPFLYKLADKYSFITYEMIADMIAISEATPGPIGVNMATYVGAMSYGVFGGIATTLGLVAPSVIIIIIVSKFIMKFRDSDAVKRVFSGLRPAVLGMISAAGFGVVSYALFGVKEWSMEAIEAGGLFNPGYLIIFALVCLGMIFFKKLHPVVYIAAGAAAGVIFGF
ncbi:MAG: chromate transporter [Firmicutes bacterium]|nr:chromate transporter [Bacillota bacterium]